MIPHQYFVKLLQFYALDDSKALEWVRTPHCIFGNQTPEQACKSEDGRRKVMRYIDWRMGT